MSTTRLGLAAMAFGALAFGGAPALAQGVPPGSGKQAFIDALADMEPVQMTFQSVSSPGENSSRSMETYARMIEEWSGGKITVEIVYGSAIIRGNNAPAIADGRLSYGGVISQYDPSNFPIASALVDLSVVSDPRPLYGTLHSYGVMMEASNAIPEAWTEQQDYGIQPLMILMGAPPSGLFCSQPRTGLADLEGARVRSGSVMHAKEVEALGASNVSLPYSEMFEALQRGIADCSLTSLSTAHIAGIVPVAPHYGYPTAESFAVTSLGGGYDLYLWEELPLAARQLLFDLQKDYAEQYMRYNLVNTQRALRVAAENGGGAVPLDPALDERLGAVNEALLAEFAQTARVPDPAGTVERFRAAAAKWTRILDEMGYDEIDPGWEGFVDWYDDETVNFEPFFDRLYQEAMLPHRPK
ncbi:hypothetical protein [Albimonas pacifica]|uniref:TRAP-type C4-dicarboxylate transport system, substrate-binding protein n=1 Tax=Albimonas pacifica TaxID=1114924 RepID=A0A1I3FB96_9RHOB|nr:hypothetical protein [Albimonas pacifica]SFI08477.1 TRAP-type C4-dicarboxylate transport system, substrate-binding protein [Albimonas pacifica]